LKYSTLILLLQQARTEKRSICFMIPSSLF